MLGTGLQPGRAGSEDEFYTAVKPRENGKQKQIQQQEAEGGHGEQVQRARSSVEDKNSADVSNHAEHSTMNHTEQYHSNLHRFLESTTPSVAARHLSETTMRGRGTSSIIFQPYFTLGDLWESFVEWSAYGAGVPLVLDGSDSAVQYYVPYLSGIQLYGESTENSNSRSNYCKKQDGTDDDTSHGIHSLSATDETSTTQELLSSDDRVFGKCSRGQLLFEFFEHETPYNREPLAKKIFDLARQYPGLTTLRSYELLHVSWISIAWYPIYRIPAGPMLKDLDACFLTYHSVSIPSKGCGTNQTEVDGIPMISLPAFGLASYKFQESFWTHNRVSENQMVSSLSRAAANWLRLLKVNHPDFQFFASHGMHQK